MTEIGALFTKKLDASRAGIGGAMGNLMKLIQREDPPLHAHLVRGRPSNMLDTEICFFRFPFLLHLMNVSHCAYVICYNSYLN